MERAKKLFHCRKPRICESIEALKVAYKAGDVSKADLAAALSPCMSGCRRCNEKSPEGGCRNNRGNRNGWGKDWVGWAVQCV